MNQALVDTLDLADILCGSMGMSAHVLVGDIGNDQTITSLGKRVGECQGIMSPASPAKAYTTLGNILALNKERDVLLIAGTTVSQHGLVVSVDGQDTRHAQLLALLLLYNVTREPIELLRSHLLYVDAEAYVRRRLHGFKDCREISSRYNCRTYIHEKAGHQIVLKLGLDNQFSYWYWTLLCENPENLVRFLANALGKSLEPTELSGTSQVFSLWIDRLGVEASKDPQTGGVK
ncbi:hypothetical protein KJ605_00250 [Patescibacteria group bacterium]|nr:hypothetical protein [Patescibacteria group bacterium]MBU1970200.1 hypothetical protein [Patescibacteria group bacterium]